MRFELDIDEDEIQKLLQHSIRNVIADEGVQDTVRRLANEALKTVVHRIVEETMDEVKANMASVFLDTIRRKIV